jgi:signal transduction histidine kinase
MWLKRHAHHLLFGASLLSLAALLTWWTIFIQRSIEKQEYYQLRLLEAELVHLASRLGHQKAKPSLGSLPNYQNFEVIRVENRNRNTHLVKQLSPLWPNLAVRPLPKTISRIKRKNNRLKIMLIGEASLLGLIFIITSFLLYQYIQLEQKTAAEIRAFWERTAHKIKTPISGIKALLQTLQQQKELKSFQTYIELALQKVKEQEILADNILSGYQLKTEKIRLRPRRLSLTEYLPRYFQNSSLGLSRAKVEHFYDREKSYSVRADPHALRIILDNLIDNALKYCSPELVLTIKITEKKNQVVLIVKDNGPGFPPEQAENLFQAFKLSGQSYATEKSGSGLGLFLARQLAWQMKGDLKAHSEGKGKGAEFHLILPRA